MTIGDRFFQDSFGYKLEYEVDKVNDDGTCSTHLVKVHGIEEAPVTPTETPVEEVKEVEPKPTTAKATDAPKRAYNRKPTTTKKTTAKK